MKHDLRAISFDVFDTLLVRRVCDPKAVFYFVGAESAKRGLIQMSPDAFRNARVEAERLSRMHVPDGEVDLEAIYKVLGRIIGCSSEQLHELMEIEISVEREMILPMPGARELVKAKRRAGYQIHFISEMYLPAEFLEEMLCKHGFMYAGDRLWVSHTYRASKRSGKLFSTFLEQTGLLPGQVEHHGNDRDADLFAPRTMGIKAVYWHEGNPVRYEKLLERHSSETEGWTSLLAGAGRMARLQPQVDSRVAGLRKITADVLCPALMCHVLWILQRAKALGLNRLYFISRDGYVQFLLAKHIAATLLPDLECRYLYGSRQSWHLAGLREIDNAALEWIIGPSDGMTCGSLLKRVGLSWKECEELDPDLARKMGSLKSPVSERIRTAVQKALRKDSLLLKTVIARAEEKRALLLDYARQEGLLDGHPVGLVEIGWSGRTRASLERALSNYSLKNLHWFYFGINRHAHLVDPERVHYFLHGPDVDRAEIPYLPVVLESFCLAPHGSVEGYRREDGKVLPNFRDDVEKHLDNWGRAEVFAGIESYLKNLDVRIGTFRDMANLVSAARDLLTEFCTRPSAEEARLWGAIPFEHDQAANKSLPLAPEAHITFANVRNALIFGNVDTSCMGNAVGAWGAGSWAARKKPLYLLSLAAVAGYARVHWKKFPRKIVHRIRRSFVGKNL